MPIPAYKAGGVLPAKFPALSMPVGTARLTGQNRELAVAVQRA